MLPVEETPEQDLCCYSRQPEQVPIYLACCGSPDASEDTSDPWDEVEEGDELVQQEQSEDPKEAATAAAERNAAEQRIEEQKRIARVLQNPEVNLPQKVWVAQSSARQTKKELDALKASYSETTHELEALLHERASRQKRGSDLNAEQKEELARLMKEQARLAERIKQTEAHYEAVMAWLNRTLEKGWDDALNLNEKFGHRLIDVLI